MYPSISIYLSVYLHIYLYPAISLQRVSRQNALSGQVYLGRELFPGMDTLHAAFVFSIYLYVKTLRVIRRLLGGEWRGEVVRSLWAAKGWMPEIKDLGSKCYLKFCPYPCHMDSLASLAFSSWLPWFSLPRLAYLSYAPELSQLSINLTWFSLLISTHLA